MGKRARLLYEPDIPPTSHYQLTVLRSKGMKLTWFTTHTIRGVLVGDFDTGHIPRVCIQPNCSMIFGTDARKWWRICGFKSNASVVRAAERAARVDVLKATRIIDVLNGVTEMTRGVARVCFNTCQFLYSCERFERPYL